MQMEFKDYYQILGVPRTASADEIKKSFRTLARKYHPDVASDKRTAEAKFKEINEAYEVIGNPENRKKYDELGANWKQGAEFRQQPGQERFYRQYGGQQGADGQSFNFKFEGTGFSDFFEQFFGGGRSGGFSPFGAGQHQYQYADEDQDSWGHQAERGQDIRGDILITLEEILKGTTRSVTVRRTDARTGREEAKTFQVRIPAGVKEGQSIRLRGKGDEGFGGGSAGDLYLRVRYAQHPDFQVNGSDLICTIELSPWEAVLGSNVPVPTLEGEILLKVPAGTQNGNKLRVRGKGLPSGTGRRGDLYAEITIQVPSQSSEEEKRLWKQLAAKSTFNPRS